MPKHAFSTLDAHLWRLAWKWARYSHPNKPRRWIITRYFGMFNPARQDKWVPGSRETGFYAPGLPDEQWFGVLTRRLLRRGDFASLDDLEANITAFTIRYNKTARPYKWSYDADADHARYLERHRQPEPETVLPEAA